MTFIAGMICLAFNPYRAKYHPYELECEFISVFSKQVKTKGEVAPWGLEGVVLDPHKVYKYASRNLSMLIVFNW